MWIWLEPNGTHMNALRIFQHTGAKPCFCLRCTGQGSCPVLCAPSCVVLRLPSRIFENHAESAGKRAFGWDMLWQFVIYIYIYIDMSYHDYHILSHYPIGFPQTTDRRSGAPKLKKDRWRRRETERNMTRCILYDMKSYENVADMQEPKQT